MNLFTKWDALSAKALFNGLVFFAPVALLVRTTAGVSYSQFFLLQAILSFVVFLTEIPAGKFTDRFGYKNTMVLNQSLLTLARLLLFAAFLRSSFPLFLLEAIVEGVAVSFGSGTESAYLYITLPEGSYLPRTARINNCGTIGFLVSTISYVLIYSRFGLSGLLLATVITSALGTAASFIIPKEPALPPKQSAPHLSRPQGGFFSILLQKKVLLILVILSAISIGQVLINFFYADKLLACGVQEEWLSPIILGYSAIELLAEQILKRLERSQYSFAFPLFLGLCGAALLLLGIVTEIPLVLLLMLTLPLLLDLPSCILGEIQNQMVDQLGQQSKRAEILSVLNMGVNLFEITFLFGSSLLSSIGSTACFLSTGLLMAALGWLSRRILFAKGTNSTR